MLLDPKRVPEPCRALLPLAALWGVGDDFDREAMVSAARRAELVSLVSAVDAVSDADLYGWLAGPESRSDRAVARIRR